MIGKIHSLESFGTVDGPGIRFVAFMQGCPLRCLFCHNPDTWRIDGPASYEMESRELVEEVLRYRSFIKSGGFTATGGEPLLQASFLTEVFRQLHAEGIHTALDTSGCLPVNDVIDHLLDVTDLVLLDVKSVDARQYEFITGHNSRSTASCDIDKLATATQNNPPQTYNRKATNTSFLDHLQKRGIHTWVRHVVVPNLTDDNDQLLHLAEWLSNYSVIEKVEILPYHTMGTVKYDRLGIPYPLAGTPPLTRERADEIRKLFRQYKPCQ